MDKLGIIDHDHTMHQIKPQQASSDFKDEKGKGSNQGMVGDYEEFKNLYSCVTHPESLDSDSFQIFIKTMSFGQISVKVKESTTITEVAKRCRIQILSDYTTYDVDQMVACETSDNLTFKNRKLKESSTIKDNNIQKGDTLRAAGGLLGGGKRAKAESSTCEELLGEANDKVSLGLLKLTSDIGPVIQNVLNHIQIFNQTARTSPEATITQAMANLDGLQIKIISKAAGMNNHPNTLKTLAKAFFEADYTAISQNIKNLELVRETCTSSVEVAYLLQYFETSKFNHHRFKDDISKTLLNVGFNQGAASASSAPGHG